MSAASLPAAKWSEIWALFDPDEQHAACTELLAAFKNEWKGATTRKVIERLARGMGTRIASIEAMIRSNPDKAATLVRTRAVAVLDDSAWKMLFFAYYSGRKSELMCAFLDGIGVEHNRAGIVQDEFIPPSEQVLRAAIEGLSRIYSNREVARYLAVLVRHSECWAFVAPERDRLLQSLEQPGTDSARSATSQAEAAAASSMEFNVLDRVLIEQIVRAAMGIDGSLDVRQVEELVESALRLNEKWYRAYFHLGFMDVLLPNRQLRFDHPGDNQARRGWYLAGVIAGMVRGNDLDGLNRVINERANDLKTALGTPGGPGASIVRTAFRQILEMGHIPEALAAIRGQIDHLGLEFAVVALSLATTLVRQAQYENALAIVGELSGHRVEDENDEYNLELSRRRGQCLQAAGDFDGAEREYRELLRAGEDNSSPDLLADLGLVKGRFRSVAEVRVPESRAGGVAMRESLQRGEEHFRRAVERFGNASPKAAYALAVLGYLRWMFSDGKGQEERREKAAELASAAVSAILASEYAAIYREYGALGQAQFMLAVTRMNSMEDVQGREALAAWQSITSEAGRFPVEDLKKLLDASDAYGPSISDPIAESIWEFRREDALDILGNGPWMVRSQRLREGLTALARLNSTPCAERIRLWMLLVPLFIKSGNLAEAEEALGELEGLPEAEEDSQRVLEFLQVRTNYDPAWKESEAGMARVYLLRRLGRDKECAQELRRVFYMVRDAQRWEAEQILTMVEEWTLGDALADELHASLPRDESEEPHDADRRLRAGERVRLVFIGGNETQAQYDDAVRKELTEEWPGIEAHFEHTGWSSNWGRELARLVALANGADAVVLMPMMRTTLGRRIREALKKPWLSCTSTGKGGMLLSLREAARLAVKIRLNKAVAR
jgi:tetratricopeptide (TPR) repeat protein